MEHTNLGPETKFISISCVRLNYETPDGLMPKYGAKDDMKPNRGTQTGTLTDYGLHKLTMSVNLTYYMEHNTTC